MRLPPKRAAPQTLSPRHAPWERRQERGWCGKGELRPLIQRDPTAQPFPAGRNRSLGSAPALRLSLQLVPRGLSPSPYPSVTPKGSRQMFWCTSASPVHTQPD